MHQVQRTLIRVAAGAMIALVAAQAQAQDYTPWSPPVPSAPPTSSNLTNLTGGRSMATPPVAPMAPSRGATWPGGAAPQPPGDAAAQWPAAAYQDPSPTAASSVYTPHNPAPYQSPAPTYPAASLPAPITFPSPEATMPLTPCEGAQMLAAVGSEAILARDVLAAAEENLERHTKEQLEKHRKKLTEMGRESDIPKLEEETEADKRRWLNELRMAVNEACESTVPADRLTPDQQARRRMLDNLLKAQIELKLAYYDAKRTIPKDNYPSVEKQLTKGFDELQLPKLLEEHGVESHRDLDNELRKRGTSLDQQRRLFLERNLSQQWIQQHVKLDQEVSFEEMATYYREHPTEFDRSANTRWQMLSVAFARNPDRVEARAKIAAMGNGVLQGGDFERAAKDGDADGAPRDWPDESARLPDPVKPAIDGLPVGQMSQILEDWRGYYIVRVIERTPAHRESFENSQGELRDKIKEKRATEQTAKYLADMRSQVPVWTVLDATHVAKKAERLQY